MNVCSLSSQFNYNAITVPAQRKECFEYMLAAGVLPHTTLDGPRIQVCMVGDGVFPSANT